NSRCVQFSYASKTVGDDIGLGIQLRSISQLLEIASTAPAKIRAGRLDAIGSRVNYFCYRSKYQISLFAIDSDSNAVTWRRQRNKDGFAISVREADTTRKNAFNIDNHKTGSCNKSNWSYSL